MERLKVFIFCILFSSTVSLQAQTNFLKGYYVTLESDTIHGFIDYRSEKRNSSLCLFKTDLNLKEVKLYPKDIAGFAVQSVDFFESHSFKTRKGENLIGFFRVIINGKLSLLRYESRYLAKKETGEVFEITKRKITEDGHSKTDYHGLGMLKVLMKDCAEISSSYLEEQYKSSPDFESIFKNYNRCIGSKITESKKIKINPHLDAGIQIAPALSSLSLSSSLENAKLKNNFSFSGGVFASLFIPKINENIRFVIEAIYGKYNSYTYFTSDLTSNDLFIDYSFLRIPAMIRYRHKSLFFDIGVQNQFILTQDLKWRIENIDQTTVTTKNGTITPLTSSSGFLAGVGLQSNLSGHLLRSSARFSQSQSSNHPNKPIYQSLELIISIQLTK